MTTKTLARIALSGAILSVPLTVEAATLLGVDFGRNDPAGAGVVGTTGTSALEPGFQGFYLGNAFGGTGTLATLSYGGIDNTFTTGTVAVTLKAGLAAAGSMGGRDRNTPVDNGAFTYGDLLRDGAARTNLTSTSGDYTLRLQGLNANTAYNIRIWGANSTADVNTIYSWFNTTSGSNLIGTFVNGPGNPLTASNNNDYSVFGTVTSNASGELLFGVTSSNGSATAGYIAAFELSTIPEPSAPLLGLVTIGFLVYRRRR